MSMEQAAEKATMKAPAGYVDVEHDDGKVHAIDVDAIRPGTQLARTQVVCGAATGISSDEAAEFVFDQGALITCWECISILA